MRKLPRVTDRKIEAHIYMTSEDHKALLARAHQQSRSVNGQILHYIRRGLEQDDDGRPRT
jgi:hypothetical protein